MTGQSLRIGITIGLHAPDESLWTNGIKQNALFLARLFSNSPRRHQVRLLNTTAVPITPALPWDLERYPTMPFAAGCDGLDVLIELGGQIGPHETRALKAQGMRLVSYCCGPEYVQNIEAMIFRRPLWETIFINPDYDEMWVIPQIVDTTLHFLQTFRRCRARPVPFVWHPIALEEASKALPHGGEYRPHETAKRLTVIEPNIDVLKFCLYPILIAEQAFRADPDLVSFLHVANAQRLAHDGREFAKLMHHLDIVKAHKASFIGRVETPAFLAEHTDAIISHQWGLPLNYFYLECCWQGYPLIHNADIIEDLGYYYPGQDVAQGAARLLDALAGHDRQWQTYRENQRRGIARFHADNPELVAHYDALLDDLLANRDTRS